MLGRFIVRWWLRKLDVLWSHLEPVLKGDVRAQDHIGQQLVRALQFDKSGFEKIFHKFMFHEVPHLMEGLSLCEDEDIHADKDARRACVSDCLGFLKPLGGNL